MKKLFTLTLTFICIVSYAQQGLYQTIEQNGTETEYLEFYTVMKGETEGTTKVSGKRYWVKASIITLVSGEKIGFKLTKSDSSGVLTTQDVMSRYNQAKGFPNVSYIYHEKENDGYIATNDYIIELNNISADGLSFKSIESVFVKKQLKEKKEGSDTTQKKTKGGKFLKKLKDAAEKAYGDENLPSLEQKKVSSEDLFQIAMDHLRKLKEIQNGYTLSSKDKADLSKIKAAKAKKYADIKKANDAYWASPEGQKVLKSYGKTGNNSSKSTSKSTKKVAVMVNPNGKGSNFVHIHWTENGSSRKKTLQTRSTGSIGNIPANTKLYYTLDNSTSKVYFYTVPSGTSNASVTIK